MKTKTNKTVTSKSTTGIEGLGSESDRQFGPSAEQEQSKPADPTPQASPEPPRSPRADRPPLDWQKRSHNRNLPVPEVLALIRAEAPDLYPAAQIVGRWIWIQFPDRRRLVAGGTRLREAPACNRRLVSGHHLLRLDSGAPPRLLLGQRRPLAGPMPAPAPGSWRPSHAGSPGQVASPGRGRAQWQPTGPSSRHCGYLNSPRKGPLAEGASVPLELSKSAGHNV